MASKREPSPSMRMRKIALVICEGETEERYINLLKKWYKSPIRIVSHIEGTKITQSLVDNRTKPVRGQVPGMQMVDANASAFFVTPTGFNNVA